jgi:hypothetical protein
MRSVGFEKKMIEKKPTIRLSAYVFLISIISLVLQTMVQMLGQFLILPVILPLLLLGLVFNNLGGLAGYLHVDSGPFSAFLFRGLFTGLFWGGCIVFPLDMYRRTKRKKYKVIAIAFSAYVLAVFFVAVAFFVMLNSGWTD